MSGFMQLLESILFIAFVVIILMIKYRLEAPKKISINPSWMRAWFRCLGKIAKGDGIVSDEEATYVGVLLCAFDEKFGVNLAGHQELIDDFKTGRDSTLPFKKCVIALKKAGNRAGLSRIEWVTIINSFCSIAIVDGVLHPDELNMLHEAGRVLGLESNVYDFFAELNEYIEQQQEERTLEESYELLGVLSSASDSEVKSAYRRKAKACHPDFAEAAGLSAYEVMRSKEQFQGLGQAYEVICKHRNMK